MEILKACSIIIWTQDSYILCVWNNVRHVTCFEYSLKTVVTKQDCKVK